MKSVSPQSTRTGTTVLIRHGPVRPMAIIIGQYWFISARYLPVSAHTGLISACKSVAVSSQQKNSQLSGFIGRYFKILVLTNISVDIFRQCLKPLFFIYPLHSFLPPNILDATLVFFQHLTSLSNHQKVLFFYRFHSGKSYAALPRWALWICFLQYFLKTYSEA